MELFTLSLHDYAEELDLNLLFYFRSNYCTDASVILFLSECEHLCHTSVCLLSKSGKRKFSFLILK